MIGMIHLHHFAAALAQAAPSSAAPVHHVSKLKHFTDATRAFFERFGIWGLAAIALLDSAMLPMPWQVILVGDVAANPGKFLLYPTVAAIASAIGSLVPFFVGRLGGELFLLGKINRERYEKLRDRFERQEFLAIFVPAMGPPPTPFKLFEFCAGVFEMKVVTFLLATVLGKLVQFFVYAAIVHYYGPTALQKMAAGMKEHTPIVFGVAGLLIVAIAVWLVRKVFDRKKGVVLPVEENATASSGIVEE